MSEPHKRPGALAAVKGALMCGLTTGVLFLADRALTRLVWKKDPQ